MVQQQEEEVQEEEWRTGGVHCPRDGEPFGCSRLRLVTWRRARPHHSRARHTIALGVGAGSCVECVNGTHRPHIVAARYPDM